MKKYKSIIHAVICLIIFADTYTAQIVYKCKTGSGFVGTPHQDVALAKGTTNCALTNYYPSGNDSVVINLNYIFLKPLSGTGRYDTVTSASCLAQIKAMNKLWDSLLLPNHPLNPPSPFYSKVKIKFRLKSVTKLASQYYSVGTAAMLNVDRSLIATDNYAINIINAVTPISGDECAVSYDETTIIGYATDNNSPPDPATDPSICMLILHEIGHSLGLKHTGPSPVINPSGLILPPLPVNDYWYEDSTIWNKPASLGGANNYMSYCWGCREYLSPKQIEMCHYNLATNIKLSNTIYTGGYSTCNSPGGNYFIYGTQFWNTKTTPTGDVNIMPGAHLTISSCVRMHSDSKIIVHPGGKLTLSGADISSICSSLWQGIEVRGFGTDQSIDPGTGMPVYCGMYEAFNSIVSNAEIAVYAGQRDNNGQYITGTGGGIIKSTGCNYYNNKTSIKFNPLWTYGGSQPNNVSVLRKDTFETDSFYYDLIKPQVNIDINGTFLVDILGCSIKDKIHRTSIGVRCFDGSFIMKDHCSAPSGNTCNGVLTRNFIKGCKYGIYISTPSLNYPSTIDHAIIDQSSSYMAGYGPLYYKGGIYILNNFGTKVVNNNIDIIAMSGPGQPMNYCVYLDNCDGYIIENNTFTGMSSQHKSTGLFVNNSGPATNAIYNNTFSRFQQCLWAQNENYDPNGNTGLVINCNDFTQSRYNIGVQSLNTTAFCATCPIPVQNAGINPTQGVTNLGPTFNVRNAYSVISCNTNAENKFYINTQNAFVVQSHGSFIGNQFHPTPQINNSCSNASEVVDIVGNNPPGNLKSSYCVASNLPSFGISALASNASAHRATIAALSGELSTKTDGGATATLLNHIASYAAADAALKTLLLAPDYLSNEVLSAYFAKPGVPHAFLQEVFAKNAPIHPSLWQQVQSIGLSQTELQSWEELQFVNHLSPRIQKESELAMAKKELGLVNNERLRRFMEENTEVAQDSVIAIYALNEIPGSKVKKIAAQINAAKYSTAQAGIDNYRAEAPVNAYICDLLKYTLDLEENSTYLATLRADVAAKTYIASLAASNRAGIEGYAKALLNYVYNETTEELMLEPTEQGSGARTAKESETIAAPMLSATEIVLNNQVKLYPNPASDILNVEADNGNAEVDIRIFSLEGKLLAHQLCKNGCQISTRNLPNGIYLVNLTDSNGTLVTKKIAILK